LLESGEQEAMGGKAALVRGLIKSREKAPPRDVSAYEGLRLPAETCLPGSNLSSGLALPRAKEKEWRKETDRAAQSEQKGHC
jgi:hypothetical protein